MINLVDIYYQKVIKRLLEKFYELSGDITKFAQTFLFKWMQSYAAWLLACCMNMCVYRLSTICLFIYLSIIYLSYQLVA